MCEMNLELCINKKQFHLLLSPYLNDGVVYLLLSFFVLLIILCLKTEARCKWKRQNTNATQFHESPIGELLHHRRRAWKEEKIEIRVVSGETNLILRHNIKLNFPMSLSYRTNTSDKPNVSLVHG